MASQMMLLMLMMMTMNKKKKLKSIETIKVIRQVLLFCQHALCPTIQLFIYPNLVSVCWLIYENKQENRTTIMGEGLSDDLIDIAKAFNY